MTIASELLARGYCVADLSKDAAQVMDLVKGEALAFLRQPPDIKVREHFAGEHLGYRPIGGEYAGSPEMWDVNESLNYSHMGVCNDRLSSPDGGFYLEAARLMSILDNIVQSVLAELRSHYSSSGSAPVTISASWLQVNYYRMDIARKAHRTILQGRHEDGHLLTLWNSIEEGMEIFADGPDMNPTPVVLNPSQILIMPGDLMEKATGGEIKPLFHEVRRCDNITERLAMMYFVNPDPCVPCFPFNPKAPAVDLAEIVAHDKLLIRPGKPDLNLLRGEPE